MLTGSCHCGKIGWTLEGDPGSIMECNCTLCRRYRNPVAYDYEDERIALTGPTASYTRAGRDESSLEILFCPNGACVLGWRGLRLEPDDRRRMAANVRLAPPDAVHDLSIDRFDGLESFEELPSDGRCVRDFLWA